MGDVIADPINAGRRDPRVRWRMYVERELVDEVWLDCSNPDLARLLQTVKRRHLQLADRADEAGQLWLVEMYDPAEGGMQAAHFGTDTTWVEGTVSPEELARAAANAVIGLTRLSGSVIILHHHHDDH